MAVVEVSIKIGDSANYGTDPVNGWRDGAPIEVKPPGFFFSPAECQDYFDTGTPPSSWSSLRAHDQEVIKRRLDQLTYLTEPGRTALEVTTIRNPDDPTNVKNLATAQKMIAQAEGAVFQMTTYGLDTAWGWNDLRVHGVILMDIGWNDWLNFMDPPIITTDHPVAPLRTARRKRWRVTYENFVPAGTIADLQDNGTYVAVNRGMTPRTTADVELIT
jgi:hypothetical protein